MLWIEHGYNLAKPLVGMQEKLKTREPLEIDPPFLLAWIEIGLKRNMVSMSVSSSSIGKRADLLRAHFSSVTRNNNMYDYFVIHQKKIG
jgi:hypothetical protein